MTEAISLGPFAAFIGLQVERASSDRVVLRWTVGPEQWQTYGIVHGGVHCAVVETAASLGAALWMGRRGQVVGVSNQTNFLRAVREGALTATAVPVDRGQYQQLWDVEVTDDRGRLVAVGHVRLQNIESDAAPPSVPADSSTGDGARA
jgi:1,4-dihydroxy-2-naphthoyl-CoA hydrolase